MPDYHPGDTALVTIARPGPSGGYWIATTGQRGCEVWVPASALRPVREADGLGERGA